jgi:MerR family transcriptional regulator, copper efflux regulator
MTYSIGEAARLAGVGVETVRFYERKGLITRPTRPETGRRRYTEATVSRIHFIQRAKHLGFSLREVAELISLRLDSVSTCEAVRTQAELKVRDIERRIADLEKMRSALGKLVKSCIAGKGPSSECPILDALENAEDFDEIGRADF